jgi:hypothetical protein
MSGSDGRRGWSLHESGRACGKPHDWIRCVLLPRGGIAPATRQRLAKQHAVKLLRASAARGQWSTARTSLNWKQWAKLKPIADTNHGRFARLTCYARSTPTCVPGSFRTPPHFCKKRLNGIRAGVEWFKIPCYLAIVSLIGPFNSLYCLPCMEPPRTTKSCILCALWV